MSQFLPPQNPVNPVAEIYAPLFDLGTLRSCGISPVHSKNTQSRYNFCSQPRARAIENQRNLFLASRRNSRQLNAPRP
jgi:hypothetical protein